MTKHREKQEAIMKKLERAAEQAGQFRFSRNFYAIQEPYNCMVACHPKNKRKNKRNFWGFPFDHNMITSIPFYINASPMEFSNQRYIAAQGPRRSTFKEFWHMTWAENAGIIVSVTNEKERMGDRIRLKFDQFWPSNGRKTYGPFKVETLDSCIVDSWNERPERILQRRLTVTHSNEQREIIHLHMENWMDDNVIHPESLFALCRHVDACQKEGTIVVHCAAGVGRTGTFIACHSLYHDLKKHFHKNEAIEFDIAERVRAMRSLRWGSVVGHSKQYALVIEALKLAYDHIHANLI